jgi:hypothetical protein
MLRSFQSLPCSFAATHTVWWAQHPKRPDAREARNITRKYILGQPFVGETPKNSQEFLGILPAKNLSHAFKI